MKMDKITFGQYLIIQDIETLADHIGVYANADCGFRAFDAALHASKGHTKKARIARETLQKIISNPSWNPNYVSIDTWHPEERAMIRGKEDIAIAVIKHKRFDKARLPQVVASAKQFGAKKVLAYLEKRLGKQKVRG